MAKTSLSLTSRNLNWMYKPFLLAPAGKDYLWGGNYLKNNYNKTLPLSPLAETWECSTHPDGPSVVAQGEFAGMALDVLLKEHPEFLGSHPRQTIPDREGLPVLVKLIDARENLSVQVHPTDAYAALHENHSLGKTEMWYILDAKPGARLVYGFTNDMSEKTVRDSLQKKQLEKYLQYIPVYKDDVFFIPPGTVHAIGEGIVLAEIQESSNLTYRLYDYDRLDKAGTPRLLHIEKALDVLNKKSSVQPRQPIRVLRYHPGCAEEFLGRCKYFQVERLLINTGKDQAADVSTTTLSFRILLCTEGQGSLHASTDEISFQKGDCLFIPACSVPCKLTGKAQLLRIQC